MLDQLLFNYNGYITVGSCFNDHMAETDFLRGHDTIVHGRLLQKKNIHIIRHN